MGLKSIAQSLSRERLYNYAITFGFEFLIMVISVLLFKMVNLKFYSNGFSEYTINKRLVGFLMPLLMVGMGVSLPKFLSIESHKKQLEIHYTALLVLSGIFMAFLLLGFLFSTYFSKMVFGDMDHEQMCMVVVLYVFSLMVHACLYNYFRGKFKFKISSFLQLVNIGLLPLLAYFLADSIFHYFLYLSLMTLLLLLTVNVLWIPFLRLTWSDFKSSFKKLMNYGIQRMPGDVVLGLFFAVPTFIASNFFSLTIAGNIAFCLSLFNIIIALMSPVNIILLPEASKIVFEKNFALLKSISTKLLLLSIALGVFTFCIVFLFGAEILNAFSVENAVESEKYLLVIFFGVIGYSVFSVIRSIVDAFYETAKVSANILISFCVFMALLLLLRIFDSFTIVNTLLVFAVAVNSLGLLTYLSLIKIFKPQRK